MKTKYTEKPTTKPEPERRAMDKEFHDDIYSYGYNGLRSIGLWHYVTENRRKERIFMCYRCFIYLYKATNMSLAFVGLYFSLWDFKLISQNLSTTLFAFSIFARSTYFSANSVKIDNMRFSFYLDRLRHTEEEQVLVKDEYELIYRRMKKAFFYAGVVFLSVWLSSTLLTLHWGPRELPFSLWLPIDLNKDKDFFIGFIFQSVIGTYVTIEGIYMELNFFSLILQLALQYEMLVNEVAKIRVFYMSPITVDGKKDFNSHLIEIKVKFLLRNCIESHVKINRNIQMLEGICRGPVFLQLTCSMALMVCNGIEMIVIGYTTVIVSDLFIICFLTNYMQKQRQKLVNTVYDLPWYEMDYKLQRDILLVMIGTQINKTLTAWKFFKLDFYMFSGVVKTVTNWLTLFWQLTKRYNEL